MRILFFLITLLPFIASAADFTISISGGSSGKQPFVYKKSTDTKIGVVMVLPGGTDLIKLSNGELFSSSNGTFILYESLADCQANSGTMYIFSNGNYSGSTFQFKRDNGFYKISTQLLNISNPGAWINGSCNNMSGNYEVRPLSIISNTTGFVDISGGGIGNSASNSFFEIKVE